MTVRESPVEQVPIEQTTVAHAGSLVALDALDGGGAGLGSTPSLQRCDAIIISERAAALIRAGLAVRAFVLSTLETVYRSVDVRPGTRIVLEGGIYRAQPA